MEERLLRDALRARPLETDELEDDLVIEKMGDTAFNWILAAVQGGALTPEETERGLRLLARLTRHFCWHRKGDLLDLILRLAQSLTAPPIVRSVAAHIAAINALIAKELKDSSVAYGRSAEDVQAEVSHALRRGLEIGLEPNIETFAKEFLAANPTRR